MTWNVSFAVLMMGLAFPTARACSCSAPPPPCQAFATTPLIFTGTVTEALKVVGGRNVRARMRVDHGYKGVTERTIVVDGEGPCGGSDLKIGDQYLIYSARDNPTSDVPLTACSRTTILEYATEDLEFLNGLSAAKPVGRVYGTLRNRTNDFYGNDQPFPGAIVELSGPGGVRSVAADGQGRYSFDNLDPAEYLLRATVEGFRQLGAPGDSTVKTKVESRGCALIDMVFRKQYQASIRGRLVRSNGSLASAGISVDLLASSGSRGPDSAHFYLSKQSATNADGTYSFEELSPGPYKIVVNLYHRPNEESPYPTLYWPAARQEEQAGIIEVADQAILQRYDILLPPEPKMIRISGVVLAGDSTPVPDLRLSISALPDNGIGDDVVTDAQGRFSFLAADGFRYRVSAARWYPNPMHTAEIEFSPGSLAHPLTLILDRPGRFDGDPMLRN
jgi:hypothetical protein